MEPDQTRVDPHSHDSADRVDTALASSSRGIRTLAWSFVALSPTAVTQLVIVLFTGWVALLGDTIYNFADAPLQLHRRRPRPAAAVR